MNKTRLAPSPTGALHLGNARTFLINWLLARQNGWHVAMRIEDLDGPRVKRGADRSAIDDLQWLGLDWDGAPVYQSSRTALYGDAIKLLLDCGLAYACVCSRKEALSAASAPHAEDVAGVYPGTCRGKYASPDAAYVQTGRSPAIRFNVNAMKHAVVEFNDLFAGNQRFDVPAMLGDFVIQKADGTAAYQLAVVVDDADMGITQVIRGDDLLDSAPRQILLYEAMGLNTRRPAYYHLPLILGSDGLRLAKRHGDTRLEYYRHQGVTPQRIVALLAKWCGMEVPDEIDAKELIGKFDLKNLPRNPVVFGENDDAFLTGPQGAA